jgi:hypothetical protein
MICDLLNVYICGKILQTSVVPEKKNRINTGCRKNGHFKTKSLVIRPSIDASLLTFTFALHHDLISLFYFPVLEQCKTEF